MYVYGAVAEELGKALQKLFTRVRISSAPPLYTCKDIE